MFHPLMEWVVHLSTIFNVVLVYKILTKKRNHDRYDEVYVFLLHLSVTDLIRETHAFLYDAITWYLSDQFRDGAYSMDNWLLMNLYFGYTSVFVTLFAVLTFLIRQLWDSAVRPKSEKPKGSSASILQDFGTSYGWLWSISLLVLSVIAILGRNCQPTIETNETEKDTLEPRHAYDHLSTNGLMCHISEVPIQGLESWKTLVHAMQVHLVPMWTVFVGFYSLLLIGWEVKDFLRFCTVGAAMTLWFLVDFIKFLDLSDDIETESFTHTEMIELRNYFGDVNRTLHLVYVFHHWSSVLASCVRIAIITKL